MTERPAAPPAPARPVVSRLAGLLGAIASVAATCAVAASAGCLDSLIATECASGYAACGGVCVDLASDPDHCGACGAVCTAGCVFGVCTSGGDDIGRPPAADAGAPGSPPDAPICAPGHTACGATCAHLATDPDHCGACFHECVSGLCGAGACADGDVGHVVLIGHDYQQTRAGINRLVGNAVFIPPGGTVAVVAYEGDASAAAIAGTHAAIDQVADEIGRGWTRAVAGQPAELPALLADAQVFLLYAQRGADDAGLVALGAGWSVALEEFVSAGGVVIATDGAADNSGTYRVLSAAGLLSVASRREVTGAVVDVVAPATAIAARVPLHYAAEPSTVSFAAAEGDAITRADGEPVVVYRLWTP